MSKYSRTTDICSRNCDYWVVLDILSIDGHLAVWEFHPSTCDELDCFLWRFDRIRTLSTHSLFMSFGLDESDSTLASDKIFTTYPSRVRLKNKSHVVESLYFVFKTIDTRGRNISIHSHTIPKIVVERESMIRTTLLTGKRYVYLIIMI